MDKGSNIETKSFVQESLGIFQLIDQIETAVDKLLERQVPVHFANKGYGIMETFSAPQNCWHNIGKASSLWYF
jgi:hypothetical protein